MLSKFSFASLLILFLTKSILAQDSLNILYYPSAKEITYKLSSFVDTVNSAFEYNYVIENLNNSQQSINFFRVEVDEEISQIFKPNGWISGKFSISKNVVGWYTIDSTKRISPNEILNSFSYTSGNLPVISNSYCRGYVYHPVVSEDPDSIVGADIYENSVIKRTIAPKTIPNPFDPLAFIDSLISMGEEAEELGWIENNWEDLRYKLITAHQHIEKRSTAEASDMLKDFLSEVKIIYNQKSGMTSEGYALMKYNGEYILKWLTEERKN